MPNARSVLTDLARTLLSRSLLSWGQIFFLWLAGSLTIAGAVYATRRAEHERQAAAYNAQGNWEIAYTRRHAPSPDSADILFWESSASSYETKATLYRIAEIVLVAFTIVVLLFLLGRSFYATAKSPPERPSS